MRMLVKSKNEGDLTITTINKETGDFEYFTLVTGVNVLSGEKWDEIKNLDCVKFWMDKDYITYTQTSTYVDKEIDKKEIDLTYAKSLIGTENGKDELQQYASDFGVKLKKTMTIDNMYLELEAKVKGN